MMHVHAWRPAVLAALIPALAFAAAPAFAQTSAPNSVGDPNVHHLTVRYGDLDLASAKDRQALEMRLQHSAATVCGYNKGDLPQLGNADERTCYNGAMAHAHVSLATAINTSRMAKSLMANRQ